MDYNQHSNRNLMPLSAVEPHEALLDRPPDDQFLYKVMRAEDLIRSISGSYLHFSRVDSYKDFSGADAHDGEQLPEDLSGNVNSKFIKAPDFSAADYYNQFRKRTYACCFSIENSDHIWRNYGNGGKKGKVCLVFRFGKLRSMLNNTLKDSKLTLEHNSKRLRQMFSINYGLIEYVTWEEYRANADFLLNPIKYIYFKDKEKFLNEKELRVSLSTIGIGQIVLNDGRKMEFPTHLQMAFDFRAAIANGTIHEILYSPDCDSDYLYHELHRFGIERRP